MPSIRYRMLEGLFRLMGVNRMLDKDGEDFDRMLEQYRKKQEKPFRVPYGKLRDFDVSERDIGGTTCYVLNGKNQTPKNAVLYLFGGGYILPPDSGDLVLCSQIAKNCDAQVWFPLYPMAPAHRLKETLASTLAVYQDMLTHFPSENTRIFGTSSGGGQALSLCSYILHEHPDVPMPGKLVLQSPGIQVPPSADQKEKMNQRKNQDVMIPPAFFDRIAPVLASGDESYLLSPILHDMTGFPPTDVFYGTHEVMYAYLDDMKAAYKKYGLRLNIHVGQGMMHCWGAMEFVPEARQVRQEYFWALQ